MVWERAVKVSTASLSNTNDNQVIEVEEYFREQPFSPILRPLLPYQNKEILVIGTNVETSTIV